MGLCGSKTPAAAEPGARSAPEHHEKPAQPAPAAIANGGKQKVAAIESSDPKARASGSAVLLADSWVHGDAVEGNYGASGEWFAATIVAVNADGSFDLAYEDGDKETRVADKLIRPASNATTTGGFALGRVAGAAFGWPLRHLASGGMRYLGQEEAGGSSQAR